MAAKIERLDMRLDAQNKKLLEQAAAVQGQTVSSFAVAALVEKARDVLARHQTTQLTQRDMKQFARLLRADEAPNSALRAAARRLKRSRG